MRIDSGNDESSDNVWGTREDWERAVGLAKAEAEAEAEVPTQPIVLTSEQSDVVDMIRGRINSGLVGHDAESQLTILETVRTVLNQMIDQVIGDLTDDDETDDETDDEYEPVAVCPACGEPIDYCQGHGELGDPAGWAVLTMHDNGDHSHCVQEADCYGLAD